MLAGMAPLAHIILGWADKHLKAHADGLHIKIHEYEWDRALMLRRTPAIIEGLLRIVIENTVITIHGATVCVVGQGTIGTVLTRYLVALGAHTHVAARSPEQRAEAFVAGRRPARIVRTAGTGAAARHGVLHRSGARDRRRRDRAFAATALLVDLAAPPGGIDFEAAQRLERKAIWGRGLGSRAPVTVGASQWGGIRARIEAILREEG